MKPIPLILMEEHHEAFFLWHSLVRKGELSGSGNTLLHIDEHSDMGSPRLRRTLDTIGDMSDLADFTYNQLTIASFILPAVYQGLFGRILWGRHKHERRGHDGDFAVSAMGEGTRFVVTRPGPSKLFPEGPQDARPLEFQRLRAGDAIPKDQPIVLDIDLDYFGTDDYPELRRRELAVTSATYEAFVSDPYHFLKVCFAIRVHAERRNGDHLLVINDYPMRAAPVTRADIEARMWRFAAWLRESDIRPDLITVCRSVRSGYTPAEHWQFIEKRLYRVLESRFQVVKSTVKDHLPQ